MALSESRGTIRRRTANLQNLRRYECCNQTSQIRKTFYDISCKGRAVHGAEPYLERNIFGVFRVFHIDVNVIISGGKVY